MYRTYYYPIHIKAKTIMGRVEFKPVYPYRWQSSWNFSYVYYSDNERYNILTHNLQIFGTNVSFVDGKFEDKEMVNRTLKYPDSPNPASATSINFRKRRNYLIQEFGELIRWRGKLSIDKKQTVERFPSRRSIGWIPSVFGVHLPKLRFFRKVKIWMNEKRKYHKPKDRQR